MKILGYILGFIVLLIGGCTMLGVSAVKGVVTVAIDQAAAEANATLVSQYQRHRARGMRSIRKSTNFCMRPRLDPDLPDSFLIDYNDIQEQIIIGQAAGTSDAEQAALLFKQQKLAHMAHVGKSLPGNQRRALKKAIKNFDTGNAITQICIMSQVNEELGEIVKRNAPRSAQYRKPSSSTTSRKAEPVRSLAPKPKSELPKLRGGGQ